jgi:hypothetical protein
MGTAKNANHAKFSGRNCRAEASAKAEKGTKAAKSRRGFLTTKNRYVDRQVFFH